MSGPATVATANVRRDVALVAAALARLDEVADGRHGERHEPARGDALRRARDDEHA